MTRRIQTLLVASVLTLILVVVGLWLPVPFVQLSPGPVTNTLGQAGNKPLIEIDGRRTYPTTGKLELTTVEEIPKLSLVAAIRGWLNSDTAVVPRDLIQPPGSSEQEVQRENTAAMLDSQDQATAAALKQLGIAPLGRDVVVSDVTPSSPAAGHLRPRDVIVSVNGVAVKTQDQLRAAVTRVRPGQSLTIGYRRGATTGQTTITTAASPDDAGKAMIGVATIEKDIYPFTVNIRLTDVGGPSAGLMFALGIVDLLTPGPLTGGRTIAGTGTIDANGSVGPIGGIQQKLLGARSSGATMFLVPSGNCADARAAAPAGLRLLKVDTLAGAISSLNAVRVTPAAANVPTC
jgi:PDZ domain-containing protein